jgi:hypothetical protein
MPNLELRTIHACEARNRSIQRDVFVGDIFGLDFGEWVVSPMRASAVEGDKVFKTALTPVEPIAAEGKDEESVVVLDDVAIANLGLKLKRISSIRSRAANMLCQSSPPSRGSESTTRTFSGSQPSLTAFSNWSQRSFGSA